ncbi:MAG TPA: site-2 protease family protein [Longimicrobiales bacterium]|nr:site-2 protease family protein [Longimicrobiales bacterium]
MADFRLGTTFGFEIRIDYSWFFLFALILWSFSSNVFPFALPGLSKSAYLLMGAMAAILFFTSLLIHELSHALVARAKGIHVAGITLFIFGGVARTSREATTPGDEFQIAGAGPLTSLLLGGVFWAVTYYGALLGLDASVVTVAGYLAILNVVLAVFNLLPGFPLDGGRLLRAVLWRASGDMTRATRWATLAGQGVAWVLIALGAWQAAVGDVIGGMWLILIAWFLRNAAVASWRQHLIGERIEEARRMLEEARAQAGLEGGVEIDADWQVRAAAAPPSDPFMIPVDRLPPGFGRALDSPTPAEPVPAATVVLARDGAAGLEVLLLKRHKSSGFVPGAYVFPGGRVDAADADAALLERMDGLPRPLRPDAPYWAAAVREAFEETGVLLGQRVDAGSERAAALDEWRERLMRDETTLAAMLDALDLRLDLRRMIELAHWITPIAEPRRYDTRFFLAAPLGGAEARIDEREMTDALWLEPAEGLRRFRAGTLPMVFPTVYTLQKLSEFRTATQALEALRGAAVPAFLPRLVRRGDSVTLELTE